MTTSTHTITAAAVDGATTVALAVIDAEVSMDESRSPMIGAVLTCVLTAETAALDPRRPTRLRVRLHQGFGFSWDVSDLSSAWSGDTLADVTTARAGTFLAGISAEHGIPWNAGTMLPSTHRSLTLTLRGRTIDHDAATVRLEAASDEALLQDYALVSTTALSPGGTSVRAIVSWVLARIGAYLAPGTADGTVELDATVWEPGVVAWDYLRPLMETAGLRLWCDEDRRWHLEPPFDGNSPTALVLSADHQVTLATDTLGRDDDWADAVVLRYRWQDAAGVTQTRVDTAITAGYSRVRTIDIDRPWPGPGAARNLLARTAGRGRVVALDAVSDYSGFAGQALRADLPESPFLTGIVSAITWRLPDDTMQVRSRALTETPVDAWIYTPNGVSWADVTPGTDWTEYAYTEEVA